MCYECLFLFNSSERILTDHTFALFYCYYHLSHSCNELYYRTLYAVRWGQLYPPGPTPGVQGGHQSLIPVLFIHLPEASEAMTIQDMANVVAEVAYTALNLI